MNAYTFEYWRWITLILFKYYCLRAEELVPPSLFYQMNWHSSNPVRAHAHMRKISCTLSGWNRRKKIGHTHLCWIFDTKLNRKKRTFGILVRSLSSAPFIFFLFGFLLYIYIWISFLFLFLHGAFGGGGGKTVILCWAFTCTLLAMSSLFGCRYLPGLRAPS